MLCANEMELFLFIELVFHLHCCNDVQTRDVILMYWRHIKASYRITVSFMRMCVFYWFRFAAFDFRQTLKILEIICYVHAPKSDICHIKSYNRWKRLKTSADNEITTEDIWLHATRTYGNVRQCQGFFDIFRHFHGESEKFTIFSRYVSISFEFFQVKTDKKAAAQRKILRNF